MDNQDQARHTNALVIATYSRAMQIRLDDGSIVRARIKGKTLKPVCGDHVIVQAMENEPDWLILDIKPRRNELSRPNKRGRIDVLAANVDQLCVVAASEPTPDWFVVDRYLCAAEVMGVGAAVIYNKSDLDSDAESAQRALSEYESIGYPCVRCSAKSGEHLDQLSAVLKGKISIIVGQSGVGKSSLINRLDSAADLRTGALSSATGEGRHTTVNSSMLMLDADSAVIDSPGVRDYAPAIDSIEQVNNGFREIADAGQDCRFANCQHHKEPNCAVKEAVDSGSISKRRYDSYRRLIVHTEQLSGKRL